MIKDFFKTLYPGALGHNWNTRYRLPYVAYINQKQLVASITSMPFSLTGIDHSSVYGHLSCVHDLGQEHPWTRMGIYLCSQSTFYVPRSGRAWPYGRSLSSYLRYSYIYLHGGCTNFTPISAWSFCDFPHLLSFILILIILAELRPKSQSSFNLHYTDG